MLPPTPSFHVYGLNPPISFEATPTFQRVHVFVFFIPRLYKHRADLAPHKDVLFVSLLLTHLSLCRRSVSTPLHVLLLCWCDPM